jgi:hypothetical protein
MKNVHGDGMKLVRNNMKLKSNNMVFTNSITTQPSYSYDDKINNYAKITTAILNNVGHEDVRQLCDFCGNQGSVNLDKLFYKTFGDWKKDKKEGNKKKNKKNNKPQEQEQEHYLGRDWIPLSGSVGSDAQALPSASRSLNSCAKCLFAVQYLPQGVILVKGLLAVFQSTFTTFWYELVRDFTKDIRNRLAVSSDNKIETPGKKEGNSFAVTKMLDIMKRGMRKDLNASMTMWLFSNSGTGAECQLERIPNFTLNFLHKAAKHGLDIDIKRLTAKDRFYPYHYSFLNCITKRLDYEVGC